MKAGKLTERIKLLRPETVTDKFGEDHQSFVEYKEVWADRNWKGGDTHTEASENFATVRQDFLIHYAHPVAEDWRVEYEGVLYAVSAIEPNRRRNYKRIICDRVNT